MVPMERQTPETPEPRRGGGKRATPLFVLLLAVQVLAVLLFVVYLGRLAFREAEPAPTPTPTPVPATPTPSPEPTPSPSPTPSPTPAPVTLERYPSVGDRVGHLTISGTVVDCDVYWGDSEAQFSLGAGIYTGSHIPGEGGTILMGAHTGTFFRDLESVTEGADITFTTDYGEYHYTVTRMAVVEPSPSIRLASTSRRGISCRAKSLKAQVGPCHNSRLYSPSPAARRGAVPSPKASP